jgi:hypothetical protein
VRRGRTKFRVGRGVVLITGGNGGASLGGDGLVFASLLAKARLL